MPETVSAAIRYTIALVATLTGALSESEVTTVTTAVIALATVGYGLFRTRKLEVAAQAA